jgi:spore protease
VVDAGAFSQDELAKGMFVTPRSIDDLVRRAGKLIGYGIDLALHSGLTCADVDMLIE